MVCRENGGRSILTYELVAGILAFLPDPKPPSNSDTNTSKCFRENELLKTFFLVTCHGK